MKNVSYQLKDVVKAIEEKSSQKARLDHKFEQEYLIPNVVEEDLIELGFEFLEYSKGVRCPTYQMGNIFALFNDQVLHVMETII